MNNLITRCQTVTESTSPDCKRGIARFEFVLILTHGKGKESDDARRGGVDLLDTCLGHSTSERI